ncbi:MAG: CtsR family transcriptional regulator [Clostridiales bacterium]|nr:CtsR family transcriptional regulator [Clostridiales bacterium]
MRLSDAIEQFIKTMMVEDDHQIELKRNELAEYFRCAPSQINYVLATRFTPEHGYVIESRRGGGGYIRIFRIAHDSGRQLLYAVLERIGDSIDEHAAANLIQQLYERELATKQEALLMQSAITGQALSLPITIDMKNALRAKILKSMLMQLAHKDAGTGGEGRA